ncbi:MAG: type III secretion system translocon subunit SctE [Hyphomicrobiales bacterium]|nr:type III secretion system translocon subunit SctE [Hyphomicrobiales bacterium]MCY4039416.1 type III secretion system translocon subunit SctE [Hyphomicrobiales bacterium]
MTQISSNPTETRFTSATASAAAANAEKNSKTPKSPKTPATPSAGVDADKPISFASLGLPALDPSHLDQQTLLEVLQALSVHIMDTQLNNEQKTMEVKKDRIKSESEKIRGEIQKIADKLAKKHHSSLVAKIFGWIGAALAVVVSAIVAVVGVVTAQPELVIGAVASAATVITLMALQESGKMQQLTDAIGSAIEKSLIGFGVDPKDAKLAGQVIAQIAVAAVIIVVQLAITVFSGGANMEAIASQVARVMANITLKTVAVVQAGVSISEGASQIAAGSYQYEAGTAASDQEKYKAVLAKMQAALEDEEETIKQIISDIEKGQDAMNEIMRTNDQGRKRMIQLASSV